MSGSALPPLATGRGAQSAKEVVRELKQKGALCLPSFFDAQSVKEMRAEADALLTEQIEGVNSLDPHPSGRMVWVTPQVFNERRFARLGEAFTSAFCREIAASYEPRCKFFRGAMITHDYKPCKITDIHFDASPALKFMVYLTDVDKDSAAFRYCLGSHRQNRKLRNRYLLMGGQLKDIPNIPGPAEQIALTDLEGPAGTLILFDTDGFHSAGSLKQGRERLLIRATTFRRDWYHSRVFQNAKIRNPLRIFVPLVVPKGRQATRGYTRATTHPDL